MNKDITKGTICTIISALIFGVTPVLSSLTFEMGSNPTTLTFYRNILAVPVLLIVLTARRADLRVSKKELLSIACVGVGFSVTTTYTLYAAYEYIGVGLSTTLHFLYPVFTVIFARLFFKDKMSKAKVIALILATLGVAIATGGSDNFAIKGIVLALASGLFYSGYLIGIDKTPVRNMDPMKATCYFGLINGIAMMIFDLPMGNIVYALEPKAFLYTFIVAVSNSFFAYVLLIIGIKLLGAGNAAIYSTLEPVSGVIAGVTLLGETLPMKKLISCLLILAAVMIPILSSENKVKNGEE